MDLVQLNHSQTIHSGQNEVSGQRDEACAPLHLGVHAEDTLCPWHMPLMQHSCVCCT